MLQRPGCVESADFYKNESHTKNRIRNDAVTHTWCQAKEGAALKQTKTYNIKV
jgi:hypothetical protein